jgi:hypothetical protein
MGTKEVTTGFLVEDPRRGKRLIFERNFRKWDGDARNGLLWFRIRTDSVLL